MTEVKREFSVLKEVITPENVQIMAELLTIKQTKTLVGYIDASALRAHEKAYLDVMCKNNEGYVLSDYYDLVQDVALFLCGHFGKQLDDFLYTSQKGKVVTIKGECYYIIKRALYHRYYHHMKNCSLESLVQVKTNDALAENMDSDIEKSYERVDKIVTLMNLNEKQLFVLNCRLQQISVSQIAAMLHCTCAGVHSFRYVMIRRYNKVMRNFNI